MRSSNIKINVESSFENILKLEEILFSIICNHLGSEQFNHLNPEQDIDN